MTRVLVNEGPAGYELRYRSGEYSAAKWFFMCLTSGRSFLDSPTFKEFAERARERVHEIEYPVRVGFGSAGMQYDWNSIDDVYAFANHFTGDMFEFGAWLKQYVSEKSDSGRERLRAEAESKREQIERERKVIIENDKLPACEKKTNEQLAEELEMSVRNVRRLRNEWEDKTSLGNEKMSSPKSGVVRVEARRVYLPLDPDAAARRLVEKFGVEFCGHVRDRINMVLQAD